MTCKVTIKRSPTITKKEANKIYNQRHRELFTYKSNVTRLALTCTKIETVSHGRIQ